MYVSDDRDELTSVDRRGSVYYLIHPELLNDVPLGYCKLVKLILQILKKLCVVLHPRHNR